jgi:hypothetical protein
MSWASYLDASIDGCARLFGRPRTVVSAAKCFGRWPGTFGSSSAACQSMRLPATQSETTNIVVTTIGRHRMTPIRARLPVAAALSCVLCLAACGSSSSSASQTAQKSPAAESISIPVCYDAAKDAMAGFLGVQAQQITTAEKTGTTGDPECTYATGVGRHEIKLLADDYTGSQPFFILDRTAEEAAQVFVPTRTVAPPLAINHIGLLAFWFPAREQLMATDGLKLITTTVTWKGVSQKHRLALAEAFIKPYIKITKQGRAAAKLFP